MLSGGETPLGNLLRQTNLENVSACEDNTGPVTVSFRVGKVVDADTDSCKVSSLEEVLFYCISLQKCAVLMCAEESRIRCIFSQGQQTVTQCNTSQLAVEHTNSNEVRKK